MTRNRWIAVTGAAAMALASAAPLRAEPLRILSLDQCADQYALAFALPGDALHLSPRADDPDSRLRDQARGHARVRPTLEAALAARPDVAVRYWGGEPRLLAALERRGVRVVQIEETADFDGIRSNVAAVAERLDRAPTGDRLIADMDARLRRAETAPGGEGEGALYLTPGGFTAGEATLVGAILRAAGLQNLAPGPYFAPMSVERLVLETPARFVLGFYEAVRADWRGPGRHPSVRRRIAARPSTALPGSLLGCPAWFAAEAAERLAEDRS